MYFKIVFENNSFRKVHFREPRAKSVLFSGQHPDFFLAKEALYPEYKKKKEKQSTVENVLFC